MAKSRYGTALGHIRTLFNVGTFGGLTDGELLERFRASNGEAAELAFAALVERHGPMVLRVCQSVLFEPHDAQDAFQATFLVLVRKAGSIRNRDSLASWLHGVAHRIAACASAATARRRRHERRAAARVTTFVDDGDRDELAPMLHEELDRLAEKYRAPIILCHLEGLTHEQTAQRLCWPVGTVRSRLARGREQLRGRLMRRGLALSVGFWKGVLCADTATAGFPAALAGATALAAVRCTEGRCVTTGVVSKSVSLLVEGAMNAMIATKIKLTVLACGLIASGAVVLAQHAARAPASEVRSMTAGSAGNQAARPDVPDESAADQATVARELRQLDLDLLAEEVQQLRDRVKVTLRDKLRAERQDTGGEGDDSGTQPEGVNEARRAYEAARASYLAKARELKNRQRRPAIAQEPQKDGGERPEGLRGPDENRDGDGAAYTIGPADATAVGSVDMDAVFRRYRKAQHEQERRDTDIKAERERLADLVAQFKKLAAPLERLVPGSPDFVALEERIAALKKESQTERETLDRQANRRQARTTAALYQEVQDVISSVARTKGLSHVVKVSPGLQPNSEPNEVQTALDHSVVYADPRNDLTEEVVHELNRRFKATGAMKSSR
jgi:RNA polymerase sigma factor (sigma-70 family)